LQKKVKKSQMDCQTSLVGRSLYKGRHKRILIILLTGRIAFIFLRVYIFRAC
jgi:hypothetical protein